MTSSPTPNFTVRAVLWDMDGTLMDSQPFWDEAFIHHCQALGGDPRPELVAQMTGASIRQARELIAATGATRSWDDPATQEVFEAIAHDVEASVSAAPPLLPGALRITSALSEVGLAQGIVSASPRRIVEKVASARRRRCQTGSTALRHRGRASRPAPPGLRRRRGLPHGGGLSPGQRDPRGADRGDQALPGRPRPRRRPGPGLHHPTPAAVGGSLNRAGAERATRSRPAPEYRTGSGTRGSRAGWDG